MNESITDTANRDSQNKASMRESTELALSNEHQELIIEGAGCASCVGKIESALKKVLGVTGAEMNFAQRTVSVTGGAVTAELIKSVENAYGNSHRR